MAPPPTFVVVPSYLPRNYYFSIKGGGGGREEAVFAPPPPTPNIVLFHRFPAILPREKWMIEIIMRGKEAEREKESVFSFYGKIEAVFLTFFLSKQKGPAPPPAVSFCKKEENFQFFFSDIRSGKEKTGSLISLLPPLKKTKLFFPQWAKKSSLHTHSGGGVGINNFYRLRERRGMSEAPPHSWILQSR